jgi:hypothetical protein
MLLCLLDRLVQSYSSEEAERGGVSGGRRRHDLSRLHALQEHPVLRRREHVATGAGAWKQAVVPERAAGVLLLLPAEERLVERRRRRMVVLAPVEVVERHDPRGRREAVVAGEADDRHAAGRARSERSGGGRRDARELLHHGAEVGRVRVEQRHGRAPRRAGAAARRLAHPRPLDPRVLGRLGRAPAAGPRRRRARGGGDDVVVTVRRGAEVRVVEPGPLREARAGVTRRHGCCAAVSVVSCCCWSWLGSSGGRSSTPAGGAAIYSDPGRGDPDHCQAPQSVRSTSS